MATSLDGKVVLVTGATSGIGLEASVKLARMGADLLMVGRDAQKAEAALAEVKARSGSAKVTSLLCDFSSQQQIRRLADEVKKIRSRLDVLINNAGTVSDVRRVTEDGIELTFAVDHLGYFLLTSLLLDLLQKSAPARIVSVASIAHRSGTMDFADLGFSSGYQIMRAYARAKLANVLFTRELAKRLDGKGVTVNCLHPGAVATNIWSRAPWWAKPALAIAKMFMIDSEAGGDRIVWLATSPDVEGKTGGYYERDALVRPSKLASDDAVAARLWEESRKLVKLA